MIRIGFWGPLCYAYSKESPKIVLAIIWATIVQLHVCSFLCQRCRAQLAIKTSSVRVSRDVLLVQELARD